MLIYSYTKKLKQQQEDQITVAYLTAYWQRVKQMPSIDSVIGKEKKKTKKLTDHEMLNEVIRLNQEFGGTTY